MVSFRKLFPVLAVIGLLLATGTASAQVQNCSASALTPLVRVEGLTEPVGAITVTCSVVAGTAPTLYFRIASSSVDFTNTIRNADTKQISATATVAGVLASGASNPFYGTLVDSKTIDFKNIALDPTATTVAVTINNVRVNASQAAKNTTIGVNITGTAVATGSTQTLLVLSDKKDVASVQQGLTFSVTAGTALSQCNTSTTAPTLADITGTDAGVLKFTPGFAYAFRGPSGANTEPTDSPAPTKGLQLEARFTGIPANADLYVSRNSTSTGSTATSTASGSGDVVKLTVGSDGTATATWTVNAVSSTDPTTPITFGVLLRQKSTTQVSLGSLQVSGNLAPRSTVTAASSNTTDVNVPRFVDVTPSYSNLIAINPCATTLLFPYVTNQGGFDTGIAISNTSKDIKVGDTFLFSGTDKELTGQPGTCTLNYFGGQGATATTSPTINPGDNKAFMLSSVASGFQGYIVAQCNFVNAHGFAFLTSGPNGMTMGYNALVIPRGSRSATGAGSNAESLGQ